MVSLIYLPLLYATIFHVLVQAQHSKWDEARIAHRRNSLCEMGSCYPATGNLLIGREKNLTASSTCGTKSQVRYCIVSHLKDKKKCFRCDSRRGTEDKPMLNHQIQNIIYSNYPGTNQPSWWQSENGKEHVTIQLDLEAEFHFTHLIMKFRTFRPAAMLIERSSDFGKTWKVYRYFAENCADSFPNAPKHSQSNLTEAVCDSRYSSVAPSNDGEVILRVISPGRTYTDPYSQELQDLLKMTNLRLNFTKLHTLGDDLLDKREEIQEKYYYAVQEMTVRGSCWCYGHAQRCLPVEGVQDRGDMVHGRCDCAHNTKGLNCQYCDDFYNDLPWAPAYGRHTNACKMCNCNNHAVKCEFNKEVYKQSGHVSGGVCINCQHNTVGNNCEQCAPGYYLDPDRDIKDPDACIPCNCNSGGSLKKGLCDPKTDPANNLEAGRCHCKANVEGRACDQCKSGYWNFDPENPDGCEPCTCNPMGTLNVSGCNVFTGECNCKPNVTEKDCNQCLPEHWGLSEDSDGCKPCECNIGGSVSTSCDVITGACKCRPHIIGRTCSTPDQTFYVPELDMVYEAETANCIGDCQKVFREQPRDGPAWWTGPGFMRVYDNTDLVFPIDDIKSSMEYDLIIRYEPQSPDNWPDVLVKIVREQPVDSNGICANSQPQDDTKLVSLPSNSRHAKVYPAVCLEAGQKYKVKLEFRTTENNLVDSPSASILVDSIALVPQIDSINFFHGSPMNELRRMEYERHRCNETYFTPLRGPISDICKKYHYSIAVIVHEGAYDCSCDRTGSSSAFCRADGGACQCKPNVVGRRCSRCAPGTYGFGPQGCKACDCNSVGALTNFCDDQTGQCPCRNGTYGRSCDQCKPGSWNYPKCQLCQCHGHAHTCDTNTGECNDCMDATTGFYCERCKEGYYGDPRLGHDIPCRPCRCPDTSESGHSFASRCNLHENTQDVVCECEIGYAGPRCDVCADNYFGNPEEPGGSCQQCDCNNNIDIARPGNCDVHTGECLQCLFNTTGPNCQICEPNFYGNALQQNCAECVCSMLGTDLKQGPCDRLTGQCPCLPNVVGLSCDLCKANYWKIASGQGCEPCECDPIGSTSEQCNEFDGQCRCRDGFGGRQCNQCQAQFWGDPNVECHPCECNPEGSQSLDCDQRNGTCTCLIGIGGEKCDKCARGYLGEAPYCNQCGECFDNWDRTISLLSERTDNVIQDAREINRTGATGAYNSEFEELSKTIEEIKKMLNNTRNNTAHLTALTGEVENFKEGLNQSKEQVSKLKDDVNNVLNQISLANLSLEPINEKAQKLMQTAQMLNDNATRLQEKDLKGALNITREAGEHSKQVHAIEKNTSALLNEADRQCRRTEQFLNKDNETFVKTDQKNEDLRQELEFRLSKLERKIPSINKNVCDGMGDPCDSLCGGGGCGTCGGISCEAGAVGEAESGLKFAQETEAIIDDQQKGTDKKFRDISHALHDAQEANGVVKEAYQKALDVKNQFEALVQESSSMAKELEEFLNTSGATPADIRTLANEALDSNIRLKPEQIKELANQINEKNAALKDVNSILEATKEDQANATIQKGRADEAKAKAEKTLEKATKVVDELEDARKAQQEAEKAISKAKDDITAARKDLTQIGSETGDADSKAKETSNKVKDLQQKLSQVQEKVFKNNHEAKQVSNEADSLGKEVKITKNKVNELKGKYNTITTVLKEKSDNSSKSKVRVKNLLDAAHQLLGDTRGKLAELQDAEGVYRQQKDSLAKLQNEVMVLLEKIDNHTSQISLKADYYRNCAN